MALTPEYGETPLPHDELSALLPDVVDLLGAPITRADIYDVEQGLQDLVFDEFMPSAVDGSLPLDELLTDHFVRNLHTRLFAPIWQWGGRQRQLELNIGVAPEQIAVELRGMLDTIAWRWTNTDDWPPRQLGIVTHAETVRIHPFVDGNGRTTRLLADLVFAAAQDPTELQYDWELDKSSYIALLRAFDIHRARQTSPRSSQWNGSRPRTSDCPALGRVARVGESNPPAGGTPIPSPVQADWAA